MSMGLKSTARSEGARRSRAHNSRAGNRSRTRKSLLSLSGISARIQTSLLARFIAWLQRQGWLCAIPLFLLLLITATDFLILTHVKDAAQNLFFEELPEPFNDTRRDAAETQKTEILSYVYIALLFLCLLHWRKVIGYFLEWPHLTLLAILLFAGAYNSIEPFKVVTNTILIIIGFLAAVLYASAYVKSGQYQSFFHIVFWPMFIIHLASLYVLTLYDFNIIDFIESSQRYGGLAGNPNSLGTTAVLGVWASAGLLLSSSSYRLERLLACFGLALFFVNTALSGSGTSTATIFIVLFALIWLRILAAFKPKVRLVINVSLALGLVFALLYSLLVTTPAEMFLSIVGGLGKDATLTGRTDLWAIAKEAISIKPVLGWGFDSHQSVMAERAFAVRYNHYHNGFLDTMIAGGFVLLAVVLYNLYRFCHAFVLTFRQKANVFPLLLPLILLLVLNISEYSLLRPNSQLWQVYFTAFVILTYLPSSGVSLQFKLGSQSRRRTTRRKTGERLRWA